MTWTRQDVIDSVIQKPKHQPQFSLSRKVLAEVTTQIAIGRVVKVEEIARKLSKGYRTLLAAHHSLYPERYATLPISSHEENTIPEDELSRMQVAGIVDGMDFLLAMRNETPLEGLDLAVYVRNHNCLADEGRFNANVLVAQDFEGLYPCERLSTEGDFKHCRPLGRVGYFLKLRH